MLATVRAGRRGGVGAGIVLGFILAACVLTRHVGVCPSRQQLIDLGLRGRWKPLCGGVPDRGSPGLSPGSPGSPWCATTRRSACLRPRVGRPGGQPNAVLPRAFPDQITGPLVEVCTVFRHSRACRSCGGRRAVVRGGRLDRGWAKTSGRRAGGRPDHRLHNARLLLVWPFTEAGRFLVPLVPFLLVGATEGIAELVVAGGPRVRWYTVLSGSSWPPRFPTQPTAPLPAGPSRSVGPRPTSTPPAAGSLEHAAPGRSGRHPGEVFWQTGRQAVAPDATDPEAIYRHDRPPRGRLPADR